MIKKMNPKAQNINLNIKYFENKKLSNEINNDRLKNNPVSFSKKEIITLYKKI